MSLPFVKMQALGNDFIVIDDLGKIPSVIHQIDATLARQLCDRRFGIGADQILWLKPPKNSSHHAEMAIFNIDGSVAEMCGNGIRAVGLYLHRHGPQPFQPIYQIETLAGLKQVEVLGAAEIVVDMGRTEVQVAPESITALDKAFEFHAVDMGNPHAVIFVQDVQNWDVEKFGRAIEWNPRFPSRTNVEFVEILGPQEIRVRVWERGAGLTLACGTGACASAVAALALNQVTSPVQVHLPGGSLKISWEGASHSVRMEGPAQEVFRGEFYT